MQSIIRAMHIAKVLAEHSADSGVTISDLSKLCELPISTMHRLLQAMIKQGMVEQDEITKKYRLGPVWLEYGLQVYDQMDYVSKIRPELERLSKEVEESVYLSKPLETEAIVMERIDNPNNPIRVYDQMGLRIPMHIGAANKSMLAAMPPEKAQAILSKLISSDQMPEMLQKLVEIKRVGYATSHSERTPGTSSVAVPIKDSFGTVIGAVSIGFVSFNLTEERLQYLAEQVMVTGQRINQRLGASI